MQVDVGWPVSLEKWYVNIIILCVAAVFIVVVGFPKYFVICVSLFRVMSSTKSHDISVTKMAISTKKMPNITGGCEFFGKPHVNLAESYSHAC